MTSPSEPVESREQPRPRHQAIGFSVYDAWKCRCGWDEGGDFWLHIEAELLEQDVTICELRAELKNQESRTLFWMGSRQSMTEALRECDAELAAALAEVSRLREQGEAAARRIEAQRCLAKNLTEWGVGYNEAIDDALALLNPAREGE